MESKEEANTSLPAATSRPDTAETLTMEEQAEWFAMRDLKRANAKLPAYKHLADEGFEIFTPMTSEVVVRNGRRQVLTHPFVRDLLFVHSTRRSLDPVVEAVRTLQYRFVKGNHGKPLTVSPVAMQRFIFAVGNTPEPIFYKPDELTQDMIGRKVRIEGGPLDTYEGHLLSIKGLRKKRLIVSLQGLILSSVEVNPENIRFI